MLVRSAITLCVAAATGALLGCAPAPSTATLKQLRGHVADLSRQVRRQQQTIDDLASRIVVLQDRVDANRVALSRRVVVHAAKVAAAPRPASPRPESFSEPTQRVQRRLPVVKLRSTRRGAHPHGRALRPAPRKTITLKLTGRPDPPRGGTHRSPLTPLPTVGERLPVVPMPGAPVGRTPIGPEADYRQAQALMKKRGYAAAARLFSRIVRRYPRHALADNAQYWLAETFFRRGQVRRAAWVLRTLLKRYPTGNKAPSAMLKLALCEQKLGRRARAKKVLSQVMQIYPGSREARLAASRLKQLR